MDVKPNWQNEEVPILVDQGGLVYKHMLLSEVDGKKKYSFTMNDINLETTFFGTAAERIDRYRKRNKTKSPKDIVQSLFEDAMETFPNSHVKTVSLCHLIFFSCGYTIMICFFN